MDERDRLIKAIEHLESQRSLLGDEVVDAALVPLREKLAEIEARGGFPIKQRKQVTILYTDIIDSTRITAHLDPEETRDLFDHTLQRLAQCVETQSGHVTRFTGDGFKAVFGSPQAHENDPEQAVRAGLEIQEASRELAIELLEKWQIEDFQVRVGINTGLVAVGGTIEAEEMLVGSPVPLAKRIESAAPAGGILISHNTYRHVRGIFDVQQMEPITAKGFEQPIPVYLVDRPKTRALRFYLRGVEGIETRMVGRESELKLLKDAFRRMIETGKGGVITILGEAGIGKSRLVYEFDKWVELLPPPAVYLFQARGRPQTQEQPYTALREMFAFRFEILDSDPQEVVLQKLEAGFGKIFGTERSGKKRAHLIGQMLGFDCRASRYLSETLDNQKQLRELAVDYLLEYFSGLTTARSAILRLEDLHWVDSSSLELIQQLATITFRTSLLILCIARTIFLEQHPTWVELVEKNTHLEIEPLSTIKSRKLLEEILQKAVHIPEQLSALVVDNAEGNPFYIEEFIKMLIESGVIVKGEEAWWVKQELLEQLEVPATLRGVLQARLDSLPAAERRVLQLASVMGRDFWDGAIHQISQGVEIQAGELRQVKTMDILASLQKRELIFPRDESAFSGNYEYSFKHILFRDVTYEMIPYQNRRIYHGFSADWLTKITQDSQRSEEYAAVIADHYLQAEQDHMASDWFFRAGKRAMSQVAMQEARHYLTKSLELIPSDDLDSRWKVLLDLDEILGILGDGDARNTADLELIKLAQELGDDNLLARAFYRQAYFFNSQGEYQKELVSHDEALAAARRAHNRKIETLTLGMKVVTLVYLDEMEAARETADLALRIARELDDEDTLATTLGNVVTYYQLVDISRGVTLVQESIEILDRLGKHNLKATSMYNLGYIYIQSGSFESGKKTIEQSLELAQRLENPRLIAYNQLNLGLVHFRLGANQKAHNILKDALLICEEINDAVAQAACHSYLGLAFEGDGDCEHAEKNFTYALESFIRVGATGYAMDARSGIARCALENAHLQIAKMHSDEIYTYLDEIGPQGMEFPILAYLTCARVFEKTSDLERRQHSIAKGYQHLMDRADKISDPQMQQHFLEGVPEHQELLMMKRST